MTRIISLVALFIGTASIAAAQDVSERVDAALAAEKGCVSCHEGIEDFTVGVMMDTIKSIGPDYGDSSRVAHRSDRSSMAAPIARL